MKWYSHLNLSFASRQKSTLSLNAAFAGKFENENYEVNIRNGYNICLNELDKKLGENGITLKDFSTYLYEYVKILRVPLPDGIDLNHYFEIMNSRGEQLEKHEILKAKLMGCFNNLPEREKYETAFDLIWEACSNMEKYVQYGFSVDQRHVVFGEADWNSLIVYDFDDLISKLGNTLTNSNAIESGIDDILLNQLQIEKKEDEEETPDRFNSVVNFQNFLLHVLRVQLKKDEVALDDKRLIELFELQMQPLNELAKVDFVKEFIYNLLKSKFLFDKYVIKRDFTANTDRWSLKCLKWYRSGKTKNGVKYINTFGEESSESFDSDNRRILMLLSMFHVSIPSMSYKYWLNASLNYLMEQIDINSKDYISYLEHIVKSFVYDRFISKNPKDYYEMIYINKGPISRNPNQINLEKLKYGSIENNLVFNYCDYLLWSEMKDIDKDIRVKSYEYTFRSSVEHHYPQNPLNEAVNRIDEMYLHQFGNLCLISHEKNSKLNNYPPEAKKAHYNKEQKLDSIKQYLIMKQPIWEVPQIEQHTNEMIKLMMDNINSNYSPKSDVSKGIKWFNEYKVKNKNLLVRVLLCFDDCAKHVSGQKYSLFDFEYLRSHNAFNLYEEFIEKKSPKNLSEIINKNLSNEKLKTEYRYLFIKYPAVIEYCKDGNFQWIEEYEGKLIYLLEADARTKNKSRELMTFILHDILKKFIEVELYIDYECFCINIGYSDNSYFLTNYNSADLQIQIWNEEGDALYHQIEPLVNGNTSAVKFLEEYKWEKNVDKLYNRFGDPKLVSFSDDYDANISNSMDAIFKLLKNGLGIKLNSNNLLP
ncbi:MAG: HNH endonuclease family protein [Bacteroidota bacterium]|nr:HNH endonuclease family protein [Bacteroidota bacterium]